MPLRTEDVQRGLTTRRLGRPLRLFDELASTNATAFDLARAGAAHGTAVLAESQTAGVGRLGRPWVMPPHHNLACSVILDAPALLAHASWIPLATGLALRDAVQQAAAAGTATGDAAGPAWSLKWPNDVLCAGKKTGGVLCEHAGHGSPRPVCVVGFGVNVNSRAEDFPRAIRPFVTSLSEATQQRHDRNALLAAMLNHLEGWYDRLESGHLDAVRRAYAASCGTLGRNVRVSCLDGQAVRGTAIDIGSDGALLISTAQERPRTVAVRSADVEHLR